MTGQHVNKVYGKRFKKSPLSNLIPEKTEKDAVTDLSSEGELPQNQEESPVPYDCRVHNKIQ